MTRTEVKQEREQMIAELLERAQAPVKPRRTPQRKCSSVRVVGYVSLTGEARMFSQPLGARKGHRVCQRERRRELAILERFRRGEADELDRVLHPDLAKLAEQR